jgi:hypothetical protein
MFFSWHGNRQLKNSSQVGAAFIILLICIAGFVVAKYLTKITGESNIAQTAACNGADSGSLSAASCWAGSLNRLVYRNWDKDSLEEPFGFGHTGKYMGYAGGDYYYYKEMNLYYQYMRGLYKQVYDDAVIYIDEAKEYAVQALDALVKIQPQLVDGEYCTRWDPYDQIHTDFLTAAMALEQAAYAVGAFHVDTLYEALISNMFRWGRNDTIQPRVPPHTPPEEVPTYSLGSGTGQIPSLCTAMGVMEDNYKNAITTGQYYAIINSGYNAPDTDAFNFWLGGGARGGSFNPDANNTVSYPPGGGGVSATIKTPKISEYEIKMAKWNYPRKHGFTTVPFLCLGIASQEFHGDVWGYASSFALSTDLRKIVAALREMSAWALSVYMITDAAQHCCECVNGEEVDDEEECKPPCAPPAYRSASQIVADLKKYTDCIVPGLNKIVNDASGGVGGEMGPASIPRFKNWNDWIMNNFWVHPDGGKMQSAKNCEEVMAYFDANDEAPGMQIININKVTLIGGEGEWKTFCDLSTPQARKTSKSKFWGQISHGLGENIGQNWSPPAYPDYYPEITDN